MRNLILKNEENEITMEVWRPIEDFPNYEVSNFGQVRNCRTGKVLKPVDNTYGYLRVHLYQNGEKKWIYIHKLVALAFIPNPMDLVEVNHRDENKLNNRVENLEWVTRQQNNSYGTRNERIGLGHRKPVEQYDICGSYIRTWISISEAVRQTGICQSAISQCCNGKYKTAGGFIWRFAENLDQY